MSTGQECSTATPEPHDLSTIRHSAVVEVSIECKNNEVHLFSIELSYSNIC